MNILTKGVGKGQVVLLCTPSSQVVAGPFTKLLFWRMSCWTLDMFLCYFEVSVKPIYFELSYDLR